MVTYYTFFFKIKMTFVKQCLNIRWMDLVFGLVGKAPFDRLLHGIGVYLSSGNLQNKYTIETPDVFDIEYFHTIPIIEMIDSWNILNFHEISWLFHPQGPWTLEMPAQRATQGELGLGASASCTGKAPCLDIFTCATFNPRDPDLWTFCFFFLSFFFFFP